MRRKNCIIIAVVAVVAVEFLGVVMSLTNLDGRPITANDFNGFLEVYSLVEPRSALKLSLTTNVAGPHSAQPLGGVYLGNTVEKHNDTTMIPAGSPIGIVLTLYDDSSLPLYLPVEHQWPMKDLGFGGCSFLPMGIAIDEGYYTEENVTDAKPLPLYFMPPCPPFGYVVEGFTFQPHSYNATVECEPISKTPFYCPQKVVMRAEPSYSEFLQDQKFHNFRPGPYTVVGGDEWGDVAIRHFQVINSSIG